MGSSSRARRPTTTYATRLARGREPLLVDRTRVPQSAGWTRASNRRYSRLVTWAVDSLATAREHLNTVTLTRLVQAGVEGDADRAEFPVAFVWLRGDRAGPGGELSKQAIASFGYWNAETEGRFDIVFPGWLADGDVVLYEEEYFRTCAADVGRVSRWEYKDGRSEILLLRFVYDVAARRGDFAFDEVVPLPVEELIRQGKEPNLDAFMAELIGRAPKPEQFTAHGSPITVWDIAERMAYDRARRSVWEWVSQTFLRGGGKVYDDVRPFRVCDLSIDKPAPPRPDATDSTDR
jgi:hypothetical protein